MSAKLIAWIEQRTRVIHVVVGFLLTVLGGVVTATLAYAQIKTDINDLKKEQASVKTDLKEDKAADSEWRALQTLRSGRTERNVVRIAQALGVQVEAPN